MTVYALYWTNAGNAKPFLPRDGTLEEARHEAQTFGVEGTLYEHGVWAGTVRPDGSWRLKDGSNGGSDD